MQGIYSPAYYKQKFHFILYHSAKIMKTFESTIKNTEEKWEKLPQDVRNLLEKLKDLPLDYQVMLQPFVEDLVRGTQRRREIFSLIQESVSQLRLDMKYLIFDLEATRRERDACRKQN